MNVCRAAASIVPLVAACALLWPGVAAGAETVLPFRSGMPATELAKATVVVVQRGVHTSELAALRDDQFIQTPAGRRISVKRYRALRALLATARADASKPRQVPFAFLPPPPKGTGAVIAPHETAAHLLARPVTDVVKLKTGSSVSVAQLKLMVPYVEAHYHVSLAEQHPGPATKIAGVAQLKALPRSAPDTTILEAPHGTRITLGALRAALKARRAVAAPVAPVRK
jgi:hypothetical protein